jgi:hypothetical protein
MMLLPVTGCLIVLIVYSSHATVILVRVNNFIVSVLCTACGCENSRCLICYTIISGNIHVSEGNDILVFCRF